MADVFRLEILSPERTFYKGDCINLSVPIRDGLYGIMAHHLPFVAEIVPGEVSFTLPDNTVVLCSVSQGMLNVGNNTVKLLSETVLRPDEIDEETEKAKLRKVKEDMNSKQSYKEYRLSEITFARAVNNLRVKKHDKANINLR